MGANTVRALVQRLMPLGSVSLPESTNPLDPWAVLPLSPIDAFAVTATLVERSGAYRHIVSPSRNVNEAFADPYSVRTLQSEGWLNIARAWGAGFHPALRSDTDDWQRFANAARTQYPVKSTSECEQYSSAFNRTYLGFDELSSVDLKPLQKLWSNLVALESAIDIVTTNDTAAWWESALWLMIISDMSCGGVGFWPRRRAAFQSDATYVQQKVLDQAAMLAKEARGSPYPRHGMLTTLASDLVDSSLCAVLPKTRTSSLGCTLRSISHNLALLPSPGLVEARWRIPSRPPPRPSFGGIPDAAEANSKTLNILLVPFPYRFGSKCFAPDSNFAGSDKNNKWGFFHIEQRWLHNCGEVPDGSVISPNQILQFVHELVVKAEADLEEIHVIVFPEFSLNKLVFDTISKSLFANPNLEFIVAGLSEEPGTKGTDTAPRKGNFAAIRARPERAGTDEWEADHSREKHHRWKVDGRQVERYGLSNSLNPEFSWWEGIPLGQRTIDFITPRAGTAMTVLICEDLARADPVQAVVRSIGPNLVLAILMDGPQRKFRWPGHYAGVLADDPGCSVLTFTSLALIARGMTSDTDQSRSVAFFKNSLGIERELFLPDGAHALALRLSAKEKEEHSLDGRGDGGAAFIWDLREVTPVRAPISDATRWIVEGST